MMMRALRASAFAGLLTAGCFALPASAQARFIASVTSSGAWRAKYSLSASPYSRLRDFLVR